jgi:hypothetical protein
MVRAVDLAVAIRAATVEEENGSGPPRDSRVLYLKMTLGADPGIGDFKEAIVHGAMRLMAIGAILHDRRVLPEERTAPLSVARVAVFVDARLFQLCGIGSSMRVVTIGARHLPFSEGHMR